MIEHVNIKQNYHLANVTNVLINACVCVLIRSTEM